MSIFEKARIKLEKRHKKFSSSDVIEEAITMRQILDLKEDKRVKTQFKKVL